MMPHRIVMSSPYLSIQNLDQERVKVSEVPHLFFGELKCEKTSYPAIDFDFVKGLQGGFEQNCFNSISSFLSI